MILYDWKDCVFTVTTSAVLSAAVDLEKECDTMLVHIPTIDSTNLTCYVSETHAGTYYPLGNSATVAAGTGGFADTWDLGGYQHIKIGSSADQTANRTFRVRGVRS